MATVRASAAPEAAAPTTTSTDGTAARAKAATTPGAAPITAASLVRQHLRGMAPYTPIEPFEVLSARYGRTPDQIVKLDANENPYGPPPEVAIALGSMPFSHIYPDPSSRALRAALAQLNGVDEKHLLVGCGADELIDLLMRVVLEPGDAIVDCPPTFTMYAFDADVNAARVVAVPRNADFSLDVPAIEAAVRAEPRAKVLFLTSPNNPDGSVIREEELLRLLQLPVLVVLDEAYIEFAEGAGAGGNGASRIAWVEKYPNLAVLRTFSKCAALAGLRVGYGAFPLDLAEYLWRAKQPYNVSVAAETAACAALTNPGYLDFVRDALVGERARLTAGLAAIEWLEPFPSQANFVLCRVKGGRDAKAVRDALAERHGVFVRHYSKRELSGFVRVSVGKPEHTDAVLAALRGM